MKTLLAALLPIGPLLLLAGCGSSNVPPAPTPDYGSLSLSATSFDFGAEIVGSSVVKTVATMTNTGSITVPFKPSLTVDPSYALVTGTGNCGTSLAAGASCNWQVNYSPTVASAPASETTTLNLNATGVQPGMTYAISLTGRSMPAYGSLSLSTTSFDFGSDPAGTPLIRPIAVVANNGSIAVPLSPAITGDPSYTLVATGGCGTSLAAGASCNLLVNYTPTVASSPASQTAVLNLNAADLQPGSTYAVALTGRATPLYGALSLSTTSFDFGSDPVKTSLIRTVAVVANTGSITVPLSPSITGDTSYSLITAGSCGSSLPAGASCNLLVNYTPTGASSPASQTAVLSLNAANLQPGSTYAVALTGRSTPVSGSFTLSSTSFDFGPNLVDNSVTKTVAVVTNTGTVALPLSPSLAGNASYSLVSAGGCGTSLAPATSCNLQVNYTPTVSSTPAAQTATLNLGVSNITPPATYAVSLTGTSGAISGTVTASGNPMVALYSLTLPFSGTWGVGFGKDTSYGRNTNLITTTTNGATTTILVAGMLPNTPYHLQANVTLANGITATDIDHTFNVGALPPGIPLTLPATTTPGFTPQPGVELVNTLLGSIPSSALATDLQGNVIWAYPFPDRTAPIYLYPIRLLPNGHFLCLIAPIYPNLPTAGEVNVIREFDLAGQTVQQLTMTDLNTRLAAHGFTLTLTAFSHDIVVLPNGHYLVIANTIKSFTNLPGYPGVTQVAGDTVVDLDSTFQPVWVWNAFDHLDVNRHPYQFPDWTHANSVAYSKDDGNFIISLRHQNWILKIDYQNGAGTGNVLWHLGEGGDFTLQGGIDSTDPTDWFYAQHDAEFASTNTTGQFSMTLFDNGDDRAFPSGFICGPLSGQTPCLYSSVSEMRIDETAKTATFQFDQILPANLYSYFAGNTEILANGNFAYDLAGVGTSSFVYEVTPGAAVDDTPRTVWELQLPGTNTYRAMRLPSLYPGVQW